MKKAIFFSAFAVVYLSSIAQRPCSDPAYRQFDFWIGEWEVFNANGQKAGDSKIELILDSCIILENWTSVNMSQGVRFAGKSYNTYNNSKKRWQQYWVDNTGGVTEYFNGHYEKGKMILDTDKVKQADGSLKIMRMTFYSLDAGKIRQHGESSIDGGKNWKTDFDLEYRKKK